MRRMAQRIPRIRIFQDWLQRERGLHFADYDALWQWSVTDLDAFWGAIWDHFGVEPPTPCTAVLADDRMPGARWFPGVQGDYARQVLRRQLQRHLHLIRRQVRTRLQQQRRRAWFTSITPITPL